MSYNFPISPAAGTLYAPPEGPTWRFLDGAWQQETEVDPPLIGAAYYDSVAQAAASTISGSLNAIQVTGYYAAGDGGGALYKRVGVAPTHAGKIHSADGAWWELAESVVTLEMFGALGANETADKAALANAIGYLNAIGGGTVRGKANRVYHISLLGGATPVSIAKPLRIDLNGATIRRPDGVMVGDNYRMLYFQLEDGASLEMYGGTIDANRTGNPGGSGFLWEHSTSAHLEVAAGANALWVKCRDLLLLDRDIFDHLKFLPGTGATIDLVHVDNVRSETAQPATGRADVIWYRGIRKVVVENCPYLHAVEAEFTANEDDWDTDIVLRDSTIKRLDLGLTASAYTHARKKCVMERLHVEFFESMSGAYFYTKDCDIILGGQAGGLRPYFWDCEGTTFRLPAAGWYMANTITNNGPTWYWRRNRLVLATGEAAPAASVSAITFPAITVGSANKIDWTFEDCNFDLNDFDRIGAPTGKIAFRRNVYRCKGDFALNFLTGSREQQIIHENRRGSFACGATNSLRFDNWDAAVATDWLELAGEWEEGVDKPVTFANGTPNNTFKLVNRRTLFGGAVPAVSAKGDTFRYLVSPTVGATELMAGAWATAAAVWRATAWITAKAVTASRPVPTANDIGIMHLDTTLDADGKPIWWTGTAWVDATGLVA